jgi:hypothetical protein
MAAGMATALTASSTGAQVAARRLYAALSLATEAAAEAVRACEVNGYVVSAAVVDVSGVVKNRLASRPAVAGHRQRDFSG